MASSSSSACTWRHYVSAIFHGPDFRRSFLSHLGRQLSYNGIAVFDKQGIDRSHSLSPAPAISIVVFSKNFASSIWCLNELVVILKCREALGKLVILIYYGVDQSDVRKQTGDFGRVFNETCARRTEEERRRWSQALTDAGNITGEDPLNWDNEVNMTEKIAKDISNKLNEAPNRGFEDMVGIEAHLQKMQSLLHLQCDDEALILGISGPAGIGKTTIARALHSRLSSSFQLTCFMENLKGIYNSSLDDYGLKLWLQEQLLSKILNQNDMSIYHLGAIPERLGNLKVLIILDDVDDLKQLEALANDTAWFGPGSRVIVITKDQELLRQHSIDNEYHVDFSTSEEALEILCRYAFRQSSPPDGFKELSEKVTELCCNLPSRLRMVGSPLRGKNQKEWENVMHRLENEKSLSNKRIGKGRSWYSTGMAFLLVINLLMEIVSAIADQLSSNRKPYFARISLVMSVTSILVSLLDLTLKVRAHKARFICKWPIPWFYYPSRGYNRIFGSFTDTVLLFCVFGHLVVSGINYSSIQKREDGPINISVWPLFFAIGMVISKFMEKPANSKDILPITKMY